MTSSRTRPRGRTPRPPARLVWTALAALLCPGVAPALSPEPAAELPLLVWEGRTMGTRYIVQIVDPPWSDGAGDSVRKEIEECLAKLNGQMSNYLPESELSRFNRAPADVPFPVSPEFARVVRRALEISRLTDGAFDITVAPLVDRWGFGPAGGGLRIPSDDEIRAALGDTGWTHLTVTARDELVKDRPGLALDLGGIAKGFGTDQVVEILQRRGVSDAFVAIAGEVRVLGYNPRGAPWRVGLATPIAHWREQDPFAAGLALSDRAVSTSGDYQKFFTGPDGRAYCHLLDPRTGRPVERTAGSVAVVAADSMTADALGTALFVLGPERAARLLESLPEAAALFLLRSPDGGILLRPSPRLAEWAEVLPGSAP